MNKPNVPLVGFAVGAILLAAGCGSGNGTSSSPTVSNSLPLAFPTPTPSPTPSPAPSSSPSPTPTNEPVSATGRYQDLVFTVTAPKRVYAQGEDVPLTFTIQNVGTVDATLGYVTATTLFDGEVRAFDDSVVVSSLLNGSSGGNQPFTGTMVYGAGQTVSRTFTWYAGSNRTPPGKYRIQLFSSADYLNGNSVASRALSTGFLDITLQ